MNHSPSRHSTFICSNLCFTIVKHEMCFSLELFLHFFATLCHRFALLAVFFHFVPFTFRAATTRTTREHKIRRFDSLNCPRFVFRGPCSFVLLFQDSPSSRAASLVSSRLELTNLSTTEYETPGESDSQIELL